MIKACLFDLDGVVVDTAKYHFLAWQRLAKELGFAFTEAQNERLKGVSRTESLDILLNIGGKSGVAISEKLSMTERKNGWYLEYILKMTPDELLPGVVVFLHELKRNGIRIALGSASKNARVILDRIGITELFDYIVDGNMVTKAKPNPEVFLKGADFLDVKPEQCVVFEDSAAGVVAAKIAGMMCVGIGDPSILLGADIVITSFENFNLETLKNEFE